MKKALVIGGSNGIGLAIAHALAHYDKVVIIDKTQSDSPLPDNAEVEVFDLCSADYSLFDKHLDADLVMVTAGIGRLALFEDIPEEMLSTYFQVNTLPAMRIAKRFYGKLQAKEPFRFGVMVSISGYMSSPFYSIYAATKAALRVFIESVNVELEEGGSANRILNVSPGSIKGTKFDGGHTNDLQATAGLAREIVAHLEAGDDLFIPRYEEVFHEVLERYHADFRAEGRHSYAYKLASGRIKK